MSPHEGTAITHPLELRTVQRSRRQHPRFKRPHRLSWTLRGARLQTADLGSNLVSYVIVRPDVFRDSADSTTIAAEYDPMSGPAARVAFAEHASAVDADLEESLVETSWISLSRSVPTVSLSGPQSLVELPRAVPNVWFDFPADDE
jgi:hypothetical protein